MKKNLPFWLKNIVELRKELHQNAELSGNEEKTSELLIAYLRTLGISYFERGLGDSFSFFVPFDSGKSGPVIVFRADLDAIPENDGAAHRCGHDGHMAILCGLAHQLIKDPPDSGKIILLFQSEEETGKGAVKVLSDERFSALNADLIFGLHNIPDFEMGRVLIKEGVFSWGSVGMQISFLGNVSHAAYPEKGLYTAMAMNDLSQFLLKDLPNAISNNAKVTLTHSQLGNSNYGSTAGIAKVNFTIRASDEAILMEIQKTILEKSESISKFYKVTTNHQIHEPFPHTKNDPHAIKLTRASCIRHHQNFEELKDSYRWSEDFGHYLKEVKGSFIGIGSGKKHAELHDSTYCFPDKIIESSVMFLDNLRNDILESGLTG